ncbi:MAG: MFS transporter [Euryarchaeota archaeon]|nr:MFS transporter [Euryarchaeota archaeon]
MRLSVSGFSLAAARRAIRTYDLVFLIALLWFMVQFLRFVFPPLFGTFQELYGVSNTQTGLLFTLLMFGYSAMQFPGGLLSDRFHEVTVIVSGAGLFTAAALFTFVAPTFGLITLAAVGIGLGTGVHKTVAIAYLSRVYPERTGLSLGIMDTVGQFGGMLAPIAVVAVLGWGLPGRTVFLLGAGASAVLAVLLYLRAKPHANGGPQQESVTVEATNGGSTDATEETDLDHSEDGPTVDSHSYVTIFTDRKLVLFLCVTVLFTFSWNGLSAFFPLFLADAKGLSSGTAGIAYSLLFAASVSQTVTGGASDRVGKLAISLSLFGVMIAGLLALLVVDSVAAILCLTVLTGIGFHGFRPVRDSYLMDLIPDSIGGGTLGIVRTFMTAIGGAAPAVIGLLSDLFGYTVAFGLIGCALAVGGLFIAVLR